MAQIKVYGLGDHLDPIKAELFEIIHSCVVEALSYTPEALSQVLSARSGRLLLSRREISPLHHRRDQHIRRPLGRGEETATTSALQEGAGLGLEPVDLEVTITQIPRHNWGIRGQTGDELGLDYDVEA